MKQKHFIDSHKGATPLAVLGLMALYNQWENPTAWIYLALHGSYGLLWVLKSRTFPDRQWEKPTGFGYGLVIWVALSLYWIAPWLLCSQSIEAPAWWSCICISLFAIGVFLHFAADMQKHVSLSLRPGLINTGLWSRLRNPNYLGELLIYLGFGLLPMHWIPIAALALMVGSHWVPNMLRKDASLSRYPEFAAYAKRSWRFIPFVW